MNTVRNIQLLSMALAHFVREAMPLAIVAEIEEETALVNPTKPYKPRIIKNDTIHRMARQLYKLKARQPEFKRKQKLYRKQYLRKNKMALERRSEFVKKARKARGLDN